MILIYLIGLVSFAMAQSDSLTQEKFLKVQNLVAQSENAPAVNESVSIGSFLAQMALGLLVVGVLFYVLVLLFKKLNIGKYKVIDETDFQVMQSFWLAQNQKVQLVRIYDKNYLLAVGPSGVQVIDDGVELPKEFTENNSQKFSTSVDRMLEKYKKDFSFNKNKKETI